MMSNRILAPVMGLALVSLFVAACGTSRIIEHPQPALIVDADILNTSDCPRIQSSNLYGGLDPSYPIAICWQDWKQGDPCLRMGGGMSRECAQAIAHVDGAFRFIGTREELQDLFAPIESPDEALSYALLATGYSAKYEPEDYRLAVPDDCDPGPRRYRYYVDTLEDTHVVDVEDGYQINLFWSQQFGCVPHPVWSITVQVNHDGTIVQDPEIKLFEENFRDSGCCID